jgi:hypothetical protein
MFPQFFVVENADKFPCHHYNTPWNHCQ